MFTDITLTVASLGCFVVSLMGNLNPAQEAIIAGVVFLIGAHAIWEWRTSRTQKVAK